MVIFYKTSLPLLFLQVIEKTELPHGRRGYIVSTAHWQSLARPALQWEQQGGGGNNE